MRLRLSALLVAASVAVAPAAFAAEYTWDMPNGFGATSSDGVGDVVFTEAVEKKSGGRIDIVNHFGGSLGIKIVDHLEAVRDGVVPIARQAMPYLGGYDPLFLLSTLPFLMQDQDDVWALYEIAKPTYEELFLKYGQVMLGMGLFPPSGLWSREPVTTREAVQNLKVRTYDLNGLETWKRAGAAAINMGWGDVFPALSTNALDAVLTSADLGISSGIQEFLPVFMEINWAIPFSAITINKEVFDGLPDDLKQVLREAGDEATKKTFDRLATQVEGNYAEMRKKNVTIVTDVPKPFFDYLVESAQPTIDAWKEKAGEKGRAILEAYARR